MPPDEYTHCCRNSAYTNAVAFISLIAPAVFARYYGLSIPEDYNDWESKGHRLWMPRDLTNQVMLEHEDYVIGTVVKQADTVLLTYPLLYDQPEVWKRNMIDTYAHVTTPNGPAMTWSIFCICALELKDFKRALDYFERSIKHVHGPYLNWTEIRDGQGAANFLTGAGGFLQSITHGFAGIRIRLVRHQQISASCPDPLHTIPVLFLTPSIPPLLIQTVSTIQLCHLHFQGRRLSVSLDLMTESLTLTLSRGKAVYVGQLVQNEGWVFGDIQLHCDCPIQLQFQPLCLVGMEQLNADIPSVSSLKA